MGVEFNLDTVGKFLKKWEESHLFLEKPLISFTILGHLITNYTFTLQSK